MTRVLLFLLCSLATLAPRIAQAQANGTIRLAPDNSPMAGVLVTDGNHVVKTDNTGRFTLPAEDGTRFISITTPAGFRPTKQFFQRYSGKDTAYDFALEKSPHPQTEFRFIQIADSELFMPASQNADRNGGWLDNLKDYVQENPTAFVMHTGDICYDAGLRFHAAEITTETIGTTMLYGIGNHDLVRGNYGEELFEELFGPVWYSFDAGNVHFVMTPMLSGDHRPSYNSAQIIRWLKNDRAQIPQG
ncbi:MAG: hypothetical protein LBV12_11160, partial [Puniceicoccales bacterium]|nr:hypothetical protein [Puniceicoccales bacterium]